VVAVAFGTFSTVSLGNRMGNSALEQEAIGLCIGLEAIGDLANHALLDIRAPSDQTGEVEVYFHSHVHEQLFLIRLLDFVGEGASKPLTGVSGSCLDVLKHAAATRSFDISGSVSHLASSVEALDCWLKHSKKIELWLPTLNINADVEVSRLEFLKISGNHLKHNLSRLTGISREVAGLLGRSGYKVDEELVPLALDDFREHLSENYFLYYGTWLAELLNNIRWGIQSYLEPTFRRAYRDIPDEAPRYVYDYPPGIEGDLPRMWFWRLMNNVRTGPYFPRFAGASYLKKESSLEWRR
jgi:hypothetical protein